MGEQHMAGRPREFDRAAALVQARDLFWERGYEGVSMSDLSERLGLASARIYAAFGSKEAIFREAIAHYEEHEGGFADRALTEEPSVVCAIERLFRDAIALYTRAQNTPGCMVVSAATNCTGENDRVREWLASHRRARTASMMKRLRRAVREGEIAKETDTDALGELYAATLHGISVQARDGVPRRRLLAVVPWLLSLLSNNPAP
ncbi:MAG: TetR/AcrR family transcriptional regulator [Acidobacteriaceae bacterium]